MNVPDSAAQHGPAVPARRGKRRRTNGEGSIWLRKDGRYGYAAYVLTTAGTYKRVQGYARSHEDARKRLTELVRRADQGVPVASVNWTVAEYLRYWLGQVVREDRRPKTYQGYEGVVRLHLIPGLGSKRLGKLTAQDVRTFITRTKQECQCSCVPQVQFGFVTRSGASLLVRVTELVTGNQIP